MWNIVAGIAALLVLATPVFPLSAVRYRALGIVHRVLQVAVLGAVVAAGLAFAQPELLPPTWLATAHSFVQPLESMIPPGFANAVWIVAAAVVVMASLPILCLVDFARRLSGHSALVQNLLAEISDSARRMETALAEANTTTREHGQQGGGVKRAIATMDSIAAAHPRVADRRRPIIDLIN